MNKKKLLYAIIIATYIPVVIFPIRFLMSGFFVFPDDTLWVIGTWLGLFAFMFIFWQYLLGIRPLTKLFTEDFVTINKLHQTLGIYGFFLVLSHPTLIFISYLTQRGESLINLNFDTPFEVAVKLGTLGFSIILLTWTVSYLIRSKLSFRWWKRLHLLNYLILPLIYVHAHTIGKFMEEPLVEIYIQILTGIFFLVFLYRLGKQFGFFRYKYKVSSIKQVTHDVVKVGFTPVGSNYINPREGQFIEIQTSKFGETHPFTAADYNSETHELFISPKKSGPFSASLSELKEGELVYLDGPYGVFTKQAYKDKNRKIVLVIGGIGVTPFLRLLTFFEKNSNNYDEFIVFYGNRSVDDIAYKDMFDNLMKFSNFKVVHVLSSVDSVPEGYEKGYINGDLIKKHLREDPSQYKFFVCGPPVMMDKLVPDMKSKGIPSKDIYSEKFSW